MKYSTKREIGEGDVGDIVQKWMVKDIYTVIELGIVQMNCNKYAADL